MSIEEPKKKRGFAAITPERMRQIASAGGLARKKAFDLHHTNPRKSQFAQPSAAPTQPGSSSQNAPPIN